MRHFTHCHLEHEQAVTDVAAAANHNGDVYFTFAFKYIFACQASVSEEAELTVCVKKMKGVPNSTLLLDDGAVEFPLVSFSYSVSYEFPDEAQYQKSVSERLVLVII